MQKKAYISSICEMCSFKFYCQQNVERTVINHGHEFMTVSLIKGGTFDKCQIFKIIGRSLSNVKRLEGHQKLLFMNIDSKYQILMLSHYSLFRIETVFCLPSRVQSESWTFTRGSQHTSHTQPIIEKCITCTTHLLSLITESVILNVRMIP